MRSVTLRLHRWAGLSTAMFLLLAGATGSVLAFKEELDAWVNPTLFIVQPPLGRAANDFLDPIAMRARVQQLYPQARADHLSFPETGKSQLFYLTPRIDPSTSRPYPLVHDEVFVSPYTGEVLGARRWGEFFSRGQFHTENLVPFVWRIHEALALPHPFGKVFMGLVALVWLFDCFIGLLLTFPRGKPFLAKWRTAWQIKHNTSLSRLNFDIHRAGALWLWIVLLFFAWSGVMFNLREVVYRPVMSMAFTFNEVRPPRLSAARLSPLLGWQEVHLRGERALATMARTQGFHIEAEDSLWYRPALGAYLYRTRTSWDLRDHGGATNIWIDGDTGVVLQVRFEGQGASGDVISNWIDVLHTAEIGGMSYRVLVACIGLMVSVLSLTGFIIWLRKRRVRRRSGTLL